MDETIQISDEENSEEKISSLPPPRPLRIIQYRFEFPSSEVVQKFVSKIYLLQQSILIYKLGQYVWVVDPVGTIEFDKVASGYGYLEIEIERKYEE